MARQSLCHYVVDHYTWPWSPNGHGHEWPTPTTFVQCQSALPFWDTAISKFDQESPTTSMLLTHGIYKMSNMDHAEQHIYVSLLSNLNVQDMWKSSKNIFFSISYWCDYLPPSFTLFGQYYINWCLFLASSPKDMILIMQVGQILVCLGCDQHRLISV